MPDLVDQPVYLRGGKQTDVVFLEDSLDTEPTVRLRGAELPEDDQLELAEMRVRALVKRLALHGISTGSDLGMLRIRRLKPRRLDQIKSPVLEAVGNLDLAVRDRDHHADVGLDLPIQTVRRELLIEESLKAWTTIRSGPAAYQLLE